jgi:hypothetical protein
LIKRRRIRTTHVENPGYSYAFLWRSTGDRCSHRRCPHVCHPTGYFGGYRWRTKLTPLVVLASSATHDVPKQLFLTTPRCVPTARGITETNWCETTNESALKTVLEQAELVAIDSDVTMTLRAAREMYHHPHLPYDTALPPPVVPALQHRVYRRKESWSQ